MSNRFQLLSVKSAELLAGLLQLVKRDNELTAEVLAHLAELEERRLHLQLGHSSSFAYCVEALGLSEGSAGRRVAAARVCRRFPEAFELVARGDLHLSALCGLAPHLNPQNAAELFATCCRKTRRQSTSSSPRAFRNQTSESRSVACRSVGERLLPPMISESRHQRTPLRGPSRRPPLSVRRTRQPRWARPQSVEIVASERQGRAYRRRLREASPTQPMCSRGSEARGVSAGCRAMLIFIARWATM